MNSVRDDRFADWDAAYILGALSPADRREFEIHLNECDSCSAAVSELAGMPGLLAPVPASDMYALVDSAPGLGSVVTMPTAGNVAIDSESDRGDRDMLPRLLAVASARRRRSRVLIAACGLAAAAVVAAALILPAALSAGQEVSGTVSASMNPVGQSSLSADVQLVPEPWGTRIDWTCRYSSATDAGQYSSAPATYALYVTDRNGAVARVSTWSSAPGSVASPTATTHVSVADIAKVEIRPLGSAVAVLSKQFDPTG